MTLSLRLIIVFLFTYSYGFTQDYTFDFLPQKIGFGSCNDTTLSAEIWKSIEKEHNDVWIWLGDNVYSKPNNPESLKVLYQQQKENRNYQSILRDTKVFGIWDDHDYGQNDGDGSYPYKIESKQLFLEFLDIAEEHPVRKRNGIYQSYSFEGSSFSILLLLLDVRSFKPKYTKSSNPNQRYEQDKEGDILGEEQWKWVEKNIKKKEYDLVLVASGIQILSSEHPYEKWENYPKSKKRLIDLMKTKAKVIFLTGDRHISEISKLPIEENKAILDFTSSGLTHSYETLLTEKNKYRISPLITQKSYGVIELNPANKPTLSIKDINGKSLFKIRN